MCIGPRTEWAVGHRHADAEWIGTGRVALLHWRIQVVAAIGPLHDLRCIGVAFAGPGEHGVRAQKVAVVAPVAAFGVAGHKQLPARHDEVVALRGRGVAPGQDVELAIGHQRRRVGRIRAAVGQDRVARRVQLHGLRWHCRACRNTDQPQGRREDACARTRAHNAPLHGVAALICSMSGTATCPVGTRPCAVPVRGISPGCA